MSDRLGRRRSGNLVNNAHGGIIRVLILKNQPADQRTLPKEEIAAITKEVKALCARFPIYRS